MNEGDVLLTSLPQADGLWKIRPVIFLRAMPPFDDLLVCGVSTRLRHQVEGFDDVISSADLDYVDTGLNETSLIRLGYLGIVAKKDVAGSLGAISADRHRRLLERLSEHLLS